MPSSTTSFFFLSPLRNRTFQDKWLEYFVEQKAILSQPQSIEGNSKPHLLLASYFLYLGKERKGKSIYISPFILRIVSRRTDMDHTVLHENYTMPAFRPTNS